MATLLVYNLVPDELRFYLFEYLDLEDLIKLRQCHNRMGGTLDSGELLDAWLPTFLERKQAVAMVSPVWISGLVEIIVSGALI